MTILEELFSMKGLKAIVRFSVTYCKQKSLLGYHVGICSVQIVTQ